MCDHEIIGPIWGNRDITENPIGIGRAGLGVCGQWITGKTTGIARNILGDGTVVVIAIHNPPDLYLSKIAQAYNSLGFRLRSGKSWQQHRGKNGDDGNNDQ